MVKGYGKGFKGMGKGKMIWESFKEYGEGLKDMGKC